MTEAAKRVLEEFETLPEEERRQVALEILRRAALFDHEPLSDAELAATADELFTALDRREQE